MPNPVVVDFIVRGMPDIHRALKTTEQAVAAAERSATRLAAQQTAQREKLMQREVRSKTMAAAQANTADRKAMLMIARERDRASAAKVRSDRQATDAAIREAEREARAKIRFHRQAEREVEQITNRAKANAERAVNREAKAWVRAQTRKQNEDRSSKQHFISSISGAAAQGVGRGITRVAGKAMETAQMVGQLGGGFGISDAVARSAQNSGDLEDLLNAAYNPTSPIKSNTRRRESAEVLPQIQAVASQYGLERSGVQGGMRAFTGATGDIETGMKLLPQLGEMARATGTDFHVLMDAAGGVAHVLDDMTDSGEKAELVMKVLRAGAGQGKAGAFEMKDQAAVMAKMVSSAGKFSGDNTDNIIKLMALAQGARSGGGAWNASTASTAVTAFTATFSKGARLKAFAANGVDVYDKDDKNRVRPPEEVIADAIHKSGGDPKKMNDMFGSVMGQRITNKFVPVYDAAEKRNKGTGHAAVLDWMKVQTKDVSMSKGDLTDAARRRMGALDAQMAKQREDLDRAVETQIVPALLKLAPEFERLVPLIVDLNAKAIPVFVDLIKTVADFALTHKKWIDGIASHPIGAIIGFELGKSVANAGIGEILRIAIAKALAGGGVPVPGGGGGPISTVASAALNNPYATAAVGTAALSTAVLSNMGNKYSKGVFAADLLREKLSYYQKGDKENGMSPEDVQAQLDAARGRHGKSGALEQAGNIVGSVFSDEKSRAYAQYKSDQAILDDKKLQADLIAAIKEVAAAARAGGAGGGGGASPAVPGAPRGKSMTERN